MVRIQPLPSGSVAQWIERLNPIDINLSVSKKSFSGPELDGYQLEIDTYRLAQTCLEKFFLGMGRKRIGYLATVPTPILNNLSIPEDLDLN